MGGVGSSGQDASGLFCPCVGVSSRFPLSVTALTLAVSWLLMGLDSSSDLCHLPQGTVVSWNGQGYSRPGRFQVGATLTILCFWKAQDLGCSVPVQGSGGQGRHPSGVRGGALLGRRKRIMHLPPLAWAGTAASVPLKAPGLLAGVRSWLRSSGRTGSRSAGLSISASSCPSQAPWRRCWLRSTPPSQISSQPWSPGDSCLLATPRGTWQFLGWAC